MKCPKYDFHIHTKYLHPQIDTMGISNIVNKCKQLGVASLAITDHLNSLDELELHVSIRKDIERLDTDVEVYFGVEGVMFSPGSDAHTLEGLTAIQDSWQIVERLRLSQNRIWRPQAKPMIPLK